MGVPSHIVSPSSSTSAVKAKKKAALQDLQLLTRFVTDQAIAPSRPSSLIRTKSSTLLVSTSSKDKGRDKEVKSCPIDFAVISAKDIENKSPVRERPSSVSHKPRSKEKDHEAKSVSRDKPSMKDFLNIKDKLKEKEAESGLKALGFAEEKATKEKEKEKEKDKDKEKDRRASKQDIAVTEERRTPDLMRPRSTAPKLKYKSQSLIIHSSDVSASPDSKVSYNMMCYSMI